MPGWALTTLKWTIAIVAMGAVVYVALPMAWEQMQGAISLDDGEPEAEAEMTEPDEAGVPTPEMEGDPVLAVAATGARGGIVEGAGIPEIVVGPTAADELLVAFDPLPADPACLTNVTLTIGLVESTETSVYVRPARVADLAALGEGEGLPPDWLPAEVEPARAYTTGAPGGLQWDVTVTYSLAAREAEPGTDVVLSVYTPEGDPERSTLLATGADDPERAPTLDWRAIAGCDDLDAPVSEAGEDDDDEGADEEGDAG